MATVLRVIAHQLSVPVALTLSFLCPAHSKAQMEDVTIEAQEVAAGIYMLTGAGGNIGLSIGDDATFIIDDQFAPLTERIVAAIAKVTDQPVDYVLNTHWHYDHTGGNENFGERGALIMAHENVHKRMAAGQFMSISQRTIEPAPDAALPVITFNDELTLRVNGQTIRGVHAAHAHTDGDTLVYFEEGNVLHMGDTFFKGRFPFIDLESGGSIDGIIAAADKGLATGDEDTRIIPGHGSLATKADLASYRNMLVTSRAAIAKLKEEGLSLEEVILEEPTSAFDESYGGGFISPDKYIAFVYQSLHD